MIPVLIAVIYFGFFSVLFGIMSRRKAKKLQDNNGSTFFTASGQIGWIAVMCSFVLAPLGGGHTTSLYENQANIGVSAVWWGIMGGGVFVPVFLYWFGPMFRKLKVHTFPQALGKIFGPKIKIFNSSVAPAAWLGIAMSELLGTATAVYALCGGKVSYAPGCILIAGALMIIYILFGGMLQASYMNIINAVMLIVGSFAAVIYVGQALPGGYEGVAATYAADGAAWKTDMFNFSPQVVFGTIIPCVVLHVLSVSSEHAMYQPMLAAKSDDDIRCGAFLGGLINTAACIPWVILGVTGTSIAVIAAKAPILSVPELALQIMPPVLIGVLMVALLCALVFSRVITNPIAGLMRGIQRMAKGDFSARVRGRATGEMKQLALAFNSMSEKLETLDQSRNQFVSNASHELKTPLATMKILIESLIYQPEMETGLRTEFLSDINREIDRLSSIVTDLLTLVRMDVKDVKLSRENMSLAELVKDTEHLLKPMAEKRHQTLVLSLQDECDMYADRTKLQQVVYNLMENAFKYTQDGGKVTVTLQKSGRDAVLKVKDNGPGIAAEHLPHIFDRFYRVDKARSREAGGTGLGLAIVHQLVMLHGGEIHVESEVGKGTTFTVELPLHQG